MSYKTTSKTHTNEKKSSTIIQQNQSTTLNNSQIQSQKKNTNEQQIQQEKQTNKEQGLKEQVLAQVTEIFDQKFQQQINQLNEKIAKQEVENDFRKQQIQEQTEKIESLNSQITHLQQRLQTLETNQLSSELQQKIQNFVINNNQAHEIWKKSLEKIDQVYLSIDQQFNDLNQYKQQIANQIHEQNINLNKCLNDNLKDIQEKILLTQNQIDQNQQNLFQYETILKQYSEEVKNYNLYQTQPNQSYNYNNYAQQQDYQQLAQTTNNISSTIQFSQSQTYSNIPQQGDYYPSQSQIYTQDQLGQTIGKSKIKLISQTQGPLVQQ